jgi:hypothetical protein
VAEYPARLGRRLAVAARPSTWPLLLQIVKRPDNLHAFQVLSRPLGRRADPGMDHPLPPSCPRLRMPARARRNHRVLGYDDHHDPAGLPAGQRFRGQ